MKTIIVTGFLGAGKTTLIKSLVENDTAVLVSELGKTNIDAKLLKKGYIEQIQSAQLSCDLSEFVIIALDRIIRKKPKHLIVETSGADDPALFLDILDTPDVSLQCVVCVIDAKNFKLNELSRAQISLANVIIINKMDLVSSTKKIETILNKLNPTAIKIRTVNSVVDKKSIFKKYKLQEFGANLDTATLRYGNDPEYIEYKAVEIKPDVMTIKELKAKLIRMKNVIRAKGIVKLQTGNYIIHKTGSQITFEKTNKKPTSLVLIGKNLTLKTVSY